MIPCINDIDLVVTQTRDVVNNENVSASHSSSRLPEGVVGTHHLTWGLQNKKIAKCLCVLLMYQHNKSNKNQVFVSRGKPSQNNCICEGLSIKRQECQFSLLSVAECKLFKAKALVSIFEGFLRTDPYSLYGVKKDNQQTATGKKLDSAMRPLRVWLQMRSIIIRFLRLKRKI